jgi:hypothetical protein
MLCMPLEVDKYGGRNRQAQRALQNGYRFHSFYGEKIFSMEASSSNRHVGDTKGMGTTDQRLKAAHERGTSGLRPRTNAALAA